MMTDQARPGSRRGLDHRARREVAAAVRRIVREAGGRIVTRPMLSGEPDGPTTRDAEPERSCTWHEDCNRLVVIPARKKDAPWLST